MNTLIFSMAIFFIALIVLSKIPGLEHTVKPIVSLIFKGIEILLQVSWSWCFWSFKTVLSAHIELFRHLVLSDNELDPTKEFDEG